MNHLYEAGRQLMLSGRFDWINDDFRVALVSRGYQPVLWRDKSFNELPYASVVALSGLLQNKRIVGDSCLDADDVIFPHVAEDRPVVNAIVLFHCPKPQTLIGYIDVPPRVREGGTLRVNWSKAEKRIIRLQDFGIAHTADGGFIKVAQGPITVTRGA